MNYNNVICSYNVYSTNSQLLHKTKIQFHLQVLYGCIILIRHHHHHHRHRHRHRHHHHHHYHQIVQIQLIYLLLIKFCVAIFLFIDNKKIMVNLLYGMYFVSIAHPLQILPQITHLLAFHLLIVHHDLYLFYCCCSSIK